MKKILIVGIVLFLLKMAFLPELYVTNLIANNAAKQNKIIYLDDSVLKKYNGDINNINWERGYIYSSDIGLSIEEKEKFDIYKNQRFVNVFKSPQEDLYYFKYNLGENIVVFNKKEIVISESEFPLITNWIRTMWIGENIFTYIFESSGVNRGNYYYMYDTKNGVFNRINPSTESKNLLNKKYIEFRYSIHHPTKPILALSYCLKEFTDSHYESICVKSGVSIVTTDSIYEVVEMASNGLIDLGSDNENLYFRLPNGEIKELVFD